MRVDVDTSCDCPSLRKGPCRHHSPPSQRVPPHSHKAPGPAPATGRHARARTSHGGPGPATVHVRAFPLDDHS